MDLLEVKIVAIGIFFFLTIIVGGITIPCFSHHAVEKHAPTIIPLFKCLTGGLFLGIVLLDLLPESAELVQEGLGEGVDFPLAGVVVGAALFFVIAIEQVVEALSGLKVETFFASTMAGRSQRNRPKHHAHNNAPPTGGTTLGSHHASEENICAEATLRYELTDKHTSCDELTGLTCSNSNLQNAAGAGGGGLIPQQQLYPRRQNSSIACQTSNEDVSILPKQEPDAEHEHKQPSITNRIIITIVLCFHTVMEGLGLGLQREPDSVWNLLIPLCLHQSLLAFIFVVNLLRCHFKRWIVIVLIFILGLSAVLGAGIGAHFSQLEMSMGEDSEGITTMKLINGVLLNVATGTFLFITFFEMLKFEGDGPGGLARLISAIMGFALIVCLDYMKLASEGAGEKESNVTTTAAPNAS